MHGGTPVIENMGIIMIEVSDFKLVQVTSIIIAIPASLPPGRDVVNRFDIADVPCVNQADDEVFIAGSVADDYHALDLTVCKDVTAHSVDKKNYTMVI